MQGLWPGGSARQGMTRVTVTVRLAGLSRLRCEPLRGPLSLLTEGTAWLALLSRTCHPLLCRLCVFHRPPQIFPGGLLWVAIHSDFPGRVFLAFPTGIRTPPPPPTREESEENCSPRMKAQSSLCQARSPERRAALKGNPAWSPGIPSLSSSLSRSVPQPLPHLLPLYSPYPSSLSKPFYPHLRVPERATWNSRSRLRGPRPAPAEAARTCAVPPPGCTPTNEESAPLPRAPPTRRQCFQPPFGASRYPPL